MLVDYSKLERIFYLITFDDVHCVCKFYGKPTKGYREESKTKPAIALFYMRFGKDSLVDNLQVLEHYRQNPKSFIDQFSAMQNEQGDEI